MTSIVEERFWEKVDFGDWLDCWTWNAYVKPNGYAQYRVRGTTNYAHRFVYELMIGPVPEGLVIDHLCRVRHCVNPLHLEAVTTRENLLRGEGWTAINAAKTHCPYGHELDDFRYRGFRLCRTCNKQKAKAWRDRRRARREQA